MGDVASLLLLAQGTPGNPAYGSGAGMDGLRELVVKLMARWSTVTGAGHPPTTGSQAWAGPGDQA
ncbi:hypothetical protein QJS66_12350 [Kocuria rhizophila]|nr:hypothetical protein QJS66_12350 [Kocuria rhizophila]